LTVRGESRTRRELRRVRISPTIESLVSRTVRIQLLGAAAWSVGDARAVPLERRDAGVLAYLAIEGPSPRATLLDLLWPDTPRDAARNHLRQRLYRLKRAMGCEPVEGGELVALSDAIGVDARDAPPIATAGDLLASVDYADCPRFDNWLSQQRDRMRRAHCDALITKASELEHEGKLAEALALADRLVATVPLEEHAHQRLMRLHYLSGDRAAAIGAFERCERLLKDELGARPGAETVALLKIVESAASAPVPTVAKPTPPSLRKPPRLIGRARELATLSAACDAGRVPIVVGAGGIGKSRLLSEWASHFDRPIVVRARPGDATAPYALLARWLRAIDQRDTTALSHAQPDALAAVLPERAASAPAARVTTSAIRSACECVLTASLQRGLTACIVDDLHWADAASLELFQHLLLADSLERCRWALACRPDDSNNTAVATLTAALSEANRLVVVTLAPLDTQHIAELVDSLALPDVVGDELAPPLARHTGGNPLFVLETLKQAFASGFDGRQLPRPLGVVESIDHAVSRLSPGAQSLVRVAAAAGADFSVGLAEAVLRTNALALADAWRELEAAQLIDGNAFVHDLVHAAVLNRVPQPILRHLYGAVADFIADTHNEPARIADLRLAAGDDARGAPALVAAADAARRAGRFIEAAQRCEQAARAYDRLGDDKQAFVQLYRGFDDLTTHASRGLYEPLVVELERRARTDSQRAMAALARAQVASLDGDWDAMASALAEAIPAARRCGDRVLEAEASFGSGIVSHSRGEFGDSADQIDAAVHLLDDIGDGVRQAEMRGSLARVLYLLGRIAEASAQLGKAIPLLRDAHVTNELAADVGFRALLALEMGNVGDALDLARQSCELLERAEAAPHEWLTAIGDRARVLAAASRYAEALDLIATTRADPRFERTPTQARLIETEAAILFELGRASQASRLLEPLEATDGGVVGYRGSRAVVALQGHALQTRRVSAELLDRARERVSGVPQRCRYAALASPHLPASDALLLCASALELAEGLGLRAHLPGLLAGHADALQRAQQHEEARRCALRAMRLLDATTPLVYRGSIWLLLHDVLTAIGDAQSAREVLLQASEWLHRAARQSVPAAYRDSFLGRNAVNRELLIRAMRADITAGE
jgi:DNA-binding SARP family transcriptional activator